VTDNKHADDDFVRAVHRSAERRRQGSQLTFWQGIGIVGAVGWMVVLPTLVGAFLGRAIDAHFGTGIFWTLNLMGLGLALGAVSAWRSVARELEK
jgi:ATP synthase protein I